MVMRQALSQAEIISLVAISRFSLRSPAGVLTSQVVLGVGHNAVGVRFFLRYFCGTGYFWRLGKCCVTAVQRLFNGYVTAMLQF